MTDTPKDPAETQEPAPHQTAAQGSVADAAQPADGENITPSAEGDNTMPRAEFDAVREAHAPQTSPGSTRAAQDAAPRPADASSDTDAAASAPAQPAQPAAGQPSAPQPMTVHPTIEQPTVPAPAAEQAAPQSPAAYPSYPVANPQAATNQTQPTEQLPPYGASAPSQPAPGAQNPYAAQQGGYQYNQNAYGQQGGYQYSGQHAAPQQPAAHPGPAGAQASGQHVGDPQTGAFGQPAYAGQQYAQQPGQPGQPGGPARPAKQKDGKGNRAGLLVTGFVLAGLLGGGVGAGVVGIYAANSNNAAPVTSSGATNVTVNDPKTATAVTAIASKVSPSVVTINVTASSEAGTGSGVVLSSDGYVLTNTHVVTLDGETGAGSISVTTNDGKIYKAKVVGTDPILDLAVIKLQNASGLTKATFGDSDKVNVGDTTVAIGAPLGLSGTVTNGIVSSLNRSIQIASSAAPDQDQQDNGDDSNPYNFWNFDNGDGSGGDSGGNNSSSSQSTISLPVIQTDAAINPGNSGGPLINGKGQIIGINVAIASASSSSDSSDQSGSIGVGFAIPSNVAQRVANDIIQDGKATSGLLGATVTDSTADSDATTVGALIKSVTSGGAAAKAGLKAGDIVTNFDGKPITNATDLTAQVRALAGGADAKLTYQRDGKTEQVSVTLGTLSSDD
ncbi:trypsin-like peptidase domain-containing protein [Humibacter albus]|uniref:trypsin-like peptidase domain-containing protein n=1 Tax=Humibacter albus TaxID=427754 RepID=UPI0003B49C15